MPENDKHISETAALIVLQGDDALIIQDQLRALVTRFSMGGWGDMNIVQLDGGSVSREDFQNAVNVLPLGGSKRLVILRDVLDFPGGKESQQFLSKAVANLPETTVLVMTLPDSQQYRKGGMVWKTAGKKHWLRKALKECGAESQWLKFPLPSVRSMPGWIMAEAKAQGGTFAGAAAAELARLIGNNTLQARHEIQKALLYSRDGTAVTREVVQLLCAPHSFNAFRVNCVG